MQTMMTAWKGATRCGGAIVVIAVAMTASAGAQQPSARAAWQGWVGCWTSAPAVAATGETSAFPAAGLAGSSMSAPSNGPVVCITPTASAAVVQFTTVADGKVTSTQRVDASGAASPIEARGCTGTQHARWSADERRLFLSSTGECGGVAHSTSGILAMTPDGDWLDVQGISAGGAENVRIARYREAPLPEALPADVADLLRGTSTASRAARVAAGAELGSAAVMEASAIASVGVVEAVLLERRQPFRLDARSLVELADAGVPARITDALVAVSNPDEFDVRSRETAARAERLARDDDEVSGNRIYVTMEPRSSPWGWGYSPYGYSRYGSAGYYDRYGQGAGGYYYPGYSYGSPVVIVRGSETPTPHGRVVKGRGYTQDDTRSSSPAGTGSAQTRSNGSSSGTSTAGSSGSSTSTGSGRTAKPRP